MALAKFWRLGALATIVLHSAGVMAESTTQSVEDRLVRVEQKLESGGLVQLMQEIELLRNEVNLLRGQLEEKDFEIQELERRQRSLYADVEQRLQRLKTEQAHHQVNAAIANPVESSSSSSSEQASASVVVTPIEGGDKAAYQAAYARVKAQKFPEAESDFAAFLENYPDSAYADNAYYWLGEVQLVQKKYTDALKSFHKVFQFSESTKRPDALLKIGFSYYELEQWAQSRKFLEQLLKVYPEAEAAKLAKTRLNKMAEQGR